MKKIVFLTSFPKTPYRKEYCVIKLTVIIAVLYRTFLVKYNYSVSRNRFSWSEIRNSSSPPPKLPIKFAIILIVCEVQRSVSYTNLYLIPLLLISWYNCTKCKV